MAKFVSQVAHNQLLLLLPVNGATGINILFKINKLLSKKRGFTKRRGCYGIRCAGHGARALGWPPAVWPTPAPRECRLPACSDLPPPKSHLRPGHLLVINTKPVASGLGCSPNSASPPSLAASSPLPPTPVRCPSLYFILLLFNRLCIMIIFLLQINNNK